MLHGLKDEITWTRALENRPRQRQDLRLRGKTDMRSGEDVESFWHEIARVDQKFTELELCRRDAVDYRNSLRGTIRSMEEELENNEDGT